MKTCGIIAEYNPFHAGHIHQLKQIRNQFDEIVVITSGYFSQRGLPSLLSPYDKTRLALEYGADLVCLLPVQYACQSAEYFVKYAMESLHYLGIDALCFGSECHSIKQLDNWYQNLKAQPIDPSHSQQRSTPVRIQPNDLLAMYYVANCKNYNIEPFCIPRDSSFASATSLRQSFFDGNKEAFSQYFHIEQYWQNYYPYLKTTLLLTSLADLETFFLVNEGIEARLKKAAQADTWESFLEQAISKNYSKARIQRTCLMILLQIKKAEMQNLTFQQIQVLGFNEIGQQLLKANKGKKIITQFHQLAPFDQDIETKTLALYNSVMKETLHREEVVHP